MCRYALHPHYKKHYACFACRKSWKRRNKAEVDPAGADHPARCPQCGLLMADMGLDFAPPRARDLAAWAAAGALFEMGETFHSCGCGGPGYRPREPSKLAAYFAERTGEYEAHLAAWLRATPATPAEQANKESAIAAWRTRIERLRNACDVTRAR